MSICKQNFHATISQTTNGDEILLDTKHVQNRLIYWSIEIKYSMAFASNRVSLPTSYGDFGLGIYALQIFDCVDVVGDGGTSA
jgi:carbohydrate-binding DOMON domain-containing protein